MKNSKVPSAILCCFAIAFIIQGVLKLSGVFIFDKVLNWDFFKIIDNNLWLEIVYYSIFVFIIIYCLSFSISTKPYSKKWWHYVIIAIASFGITTLKMLLNTTFQLYVLYDIINYILVPFIISITNDNEIFKKKSLTNIVLILLMQILLYFCYLGMGYWSSLLSSFVIVEPTVLQSSANFLISMEVYIGLVLIMLSLNLFLRSIKMRIPIDIANDEAKEKELERIKKEKDKNKND